MSCLEPSGPRSKNNNFASGVKNGAGALTGALYPPIEKAPQVFGQARHLAFR
jgi:hypothetical protein